MEPLEEAKGERRKKTGSTLLLQPLAASRLLAARYQGSVLMCDYVCRNMCAHEGSNRHVHATLYSRPCIHAEYCVCVCAHLCVGVFVFVKEIILVGRAVRVEDTLCSSDSSHGIHKSLLLSYSHFYERDGPLLYDIITLICCSVCLQAKLSNNASPDISATMV